MVINIDRGLSCCRHIPQNRNIAGSCAAGNFQGAGSTSQRVVSRSLGQKEEESERERGAAMDVQSDLRLERTGTTHESYQ